MIVDIVSNANNFKVSFIPNDKIYTQLNGFMWVFLIDNRKNLWFQLVISI